AILAAAGLLSLAGNAHGAPPPSQPPTLNDAKRRAATQMLDLARKQMDAMEQLSAIRPQTPEFEEMQAQWPRNVLCATLLTAASDTERAKARDVYLTKTREDLKRLEARVEIDTTEATLHAARYFVAEAEGFRTGMSPFADPLALPAPVATPDQRTAAQQMEKEALATITGLQAIEAVRP